MDGVRDTRLAAIRCGTLLEFVGPTSCGGLRNCYVVQH